MGSTKMKLSENFWLNEFEKSQTATRFGIDNSVPTHLVPAIQALVTNVLQPLRNQFGPIVISSGYRSKDLNKKIGGSLKSQHCLGQAADIEAPGVSNYDLACWIRDNLEFDQLILEGHKKYIPNSGWVHVSFNHIKPNRKQCLTATFIGGKANYENGLNE